MGKCTAIDKDNSTCNAHHPRLQMRPYVTYNLTMELYLVITYPILKG